MQRLSFTLMSIDFSKWLSLSISVFVSLNVSSLDEKNGMQLTTLNSPRIGWLHVPLFFCEATEYL